MNVQNTDLDRLQAAFKATFDAWIDAIRLQEQLASVDRSLAQVYLRENSPSEVCSRRFFSVALKRGRADGAAALVLAVQAAWTAIGGGGPLMCRS
jgi:hypothetical protein